MLVFDTQEQEKPRSEPMPKGDQMLKRLQALVGGHIEGLPHPQGYKAPWTAYANEDGANENLPSNFLAWGVLHNLGFIDSSILPGAYFGNVVLLGKNEKALTAEQLELVEKARQDYLSELGEEEGSD